MTGQPARRLTLVRHAKSDWGDASLEDIERPLNGRGVRDAPEMAARLAAAGLVPTLVVTSPAVRARATAAVFARTLGYPAGRIRVAEDAYLAPAPDLLDIVRRLGRHARHVMLFGHNPGISMFAARLAGDDSLADMPTCAVASLLAPVSAWSRLSFGTCRLDHYDYPKRRPA